ncbi:MAG: extracellular solute-binding protein [Phycisphaerales bacterium]|nr:extracellular solute-binding protein [Phycisphaerales bacterium]
MAQDREQPIAVARAFALRWPGWLAWLSPGGWVIAAIAVGTTVVVVGGGSARPSGEVRMWTFAPPHARMYEPLLEQWASEPDGRRVDLEVLSLPALERRMLGGFLSGVPVADLIEAERRVASRAFAGPLDAVGFLDLTDRLREDGLLDAINPASFSPWTFRGRIFGLPHDVHPVMLCYRADLVEAAGIDVSTIETWDDFARVMRPLMADGDGDGEPDRYLIAFWTTFPDQLEALILQAGDGFFDEEDHLRIATPTNARVVASLAGWIAGPGRIAADVPEFNAAGNKQKIDGYVVAAIMPDWLSNIWRQQMPELAGKLKLMPLPAWEPGGRRTSVWGGTMLGIPRTAEDPDRLWELAKRLYLSPELSRALYEEGDIVTPVKANWSDPIYDRPDPYFSGQAKGRMYLDLAPQVPRRTSSPFNTMAMQRVQDALVGLVELLRDRPGTDRATLESRAMDLLRVAEADVRSRMDRNVFARGETP